MKFLRPLWVALRAAVLATAVFWVSVFIVKNSGWQVPLEVIEPLVFFVVFFLGVMMVRKS